MADSFLLALEALFDLFGYSPFTEEHLRIVRSPTDASAIEDQATEL